MRTFTGFFSIIALGLIAGAMFAASMSNTIAHYFAADGSDGPINIDYISLFLGIIIGAIITNLAGMEWSRIPRRVAAWIVDNTDNFSYLLAAIILVFVVIYY